MFDGRRGGEAPGRSRRLDGFVGGGRGGAPGLGGSGRRAPAGVQGLGGYWGEVATLQSRGWRSPEGSEGFDGHDSGGASGGCAQCVCRWKGLPNGTTRRIPTRGPQCLAGVAPAHFGKSPGSAAQPTASAERMHAPCVSSLCRTAAPPPSSGLLVGGPHPGPSHPTTPPRPDCLVTFLWGRS